MGNHGPCGCWEPVGFFERGADQHRNTSPGYLFGALSTNMTSLRVQTNNNT